MSLNLTKIKDLKNGNEIIRIERNNEIEEIEVQSWEFLKNRDIEIVNKFGEWMLITDEEEEYHEFTDSQVNDYTRY